MAMLQLPAVAGVMAGNQLARWFGVAVLGLSAIDMMFFLPAYPHARRRREHGHPEPRDRTPRPPGGRGDRDELLAGNRTSRTMRSPESRAQITGG